MPNTTPQLRQNSRPTPGKSHHPDTTTCAGTRVTPTHPYTQPHKPPPRERTPNPRQQRTPRTQDPPSQGSQRHNRGTPPPTPTTPTTMCRHKGHTDTTTHGCDPCAVTPSPATTTRPARTRGCDPVTDVPAHHGAPRTRPPRRRNPHPLVQSAYKTCTAPQRLLRVAVPNRPGRGYIPPLSRRQTVSCARSACRSLVVCALSSRVLLLACVLV